MRFIFLNILEFKFYFSISELISMYFVWKDPQT